MPTTTWSTMRQEIVSPLGLVTGTTSANLAANTSLVDEDLTDLYPNDDYFNDSWFLIVTRNNNAGEYRRVTDYAQSSGTITVSKAWPSGSDSSTSTFELNELVHEEDILVKEGANTVSVGESVKASGFRGFLKLTADSVLRSADHDFGIKLTHYVTNKKTTITFTKEVPADGTIIKVNRLNDKYLKFRNKGIF